MKRTILLGLAVASIAIYCLMTSAVAAPAVNYFRMRISAMGGISIGNGDTVTKYLSTVSSSINIADAGANLCTVGTITVTGAAVGNTCIISPGADDAAWDHSTLTCFVESDNTVKYKFCEDNAGANPGAMTYRVSIIQH